MFVKTCVKLGYSRFLKAFYDTYMLPSPRNRSVGHLTQSCGSCVQLVLGPSSAERMVKNLSGGHSGASEGCPMRIIREAGALARLGE